jgi:myo-inositol 2-dehydrogenase/D-chiro-inositol 1-dehydrogenase
MDEKVRIGFVGCGGIAEAHWNALSKLPEAEIVAFYDIDERKARAAAERFKGHAYRSVEEMFEKAGIDAVYFCLPPFAHGAEMLAVEHGIPFFVEKPVDLNLSRAKEIEAAVREKGLLTSVGYMNRYRRGVRTVKKLLETDPPILLLGGWIGGTPRGEGIWSWWIQKDKSGGQFHEQVTHTVDLVRFFCGEAELVHAFAAKGLNEEVPEGYSIEDASVVGIKFKSGAVASLWASCSANAGGGGVSLSIYSSNMTALFTGWEHTLRLMRSGEDIVEIRGEGDIFVIEDKAFVDAVKAKDQSLVMSSYADGVKTIEITLAANRSMETGEPVMLS